MNILKFDSLDTFIAVGTWAYHNHVELFTLTSSKWQAKKDYPFAPDICSYSILTVEKKFILFGGHSKFSKDLSGGYQSTIARFDPMENSWTRLGDLNVAREAHGVIQVENEFIVVGGTRKWRPNGDDYEPTESCKLKRESMICKTREPKLSRFTHYPELMLIP